jgi:hypothetical protein
MIRCGPIARTIRESQEIAYNRKNQEGQKIKQKVIEVYEELSQLGEENELDEIMTEYEYESMDSLGLERKGVIKAFSEEKALAAIRQNGLFVTQIKSKPIIEFTNSYKTSKISSGELNMDEIKKKTIIDLLAAPITIIPLVGGISSLILSWVAGSSLLALGGIVSVVVGSAIFANRVIFGLEEITKNAYEELQEQKRKERNEILDQLDLKLRQDKDARPEQCLRELRILHDLLKKESENNIVCGDDILKNFEQMFNLCVLKIQKSDDLWRASRNIHNSAKKKLLEERENLVDEVVQTTENLSNIVRQTKEIKQTKEKSELSELQRELEKTLIVARKTEERMSKLDSPNYDLKEFET